MRIVAHTCSNTEIVCALGRADWLVGVDDHSDHPPEVVARLPRIGPDLDIAIDRIVELRPDLVITSLTIPGHERCLERIRRAGLPHLVTRPTSLADVKADIERIGHALEAGQRARELADRFRALKPLPASASRPKVLIEWWPKPVIVPGRRSWVNQMLAMAGAVNPFADRDAESLPVTPEEVQAAAPDAVVISWCGVAERNYRPHKVLNRPGWEQVPAVRNRQVIAISEALLGRPGPRLLDGIAALSRLVRGLRDGAHSGMAPQPIPQV
ncbi:MAG: cobalamin-binding protein [Wenzhouxiangellaceae bacterium]